MKRVRRRGEGKGGGGWWVLISEWAERGIRKYFETSIRRRRS